MRIRRIKVLNYAGIDEAEVFFPETGITIVEGVNEVGKTSMVKAVDAILEYLDSSSAGAIKDTMTVGSDLGPEVEVDITAGEYEFTYRKRWLRNKETVLDITAPKREQLQGREAHERVEQILEEEVDLELWRALRLDQGTGLSQAKFDVSALGRALDVAAGGDVAGDREDTLFNRIEAEYLKFWTPGGRPKGDLNSVRAELEAAQERSDEADAHLRSLDDDDEEIQTLERAATKLRQAQSDASSEVEGFEVQADEIAKVRLDIERFEGEFALADAKYLKARSDRERRDDLIAAVKDAASVRDDAEQEIGTSAPARELVQTQQQDAKKMLDVARSDATEAKRINEMARDDREYHRQLIEIELFTERLGLVHEAQKSLSVAEGVLESIKIDTELLKKIEKAHLALAEAKAVAARSQPTVEIRALRALEVSVDGVGIKMEVGSVLSEPVSSETRIEIADVAELLIRAGEDDADVARQVERAQDRYDELCRRGGAQDVVDAREKADARAEAERDKADSLKIRKQNLRDLRPDELSGKVERLTERTSQYLHNREPEPPLPLDFDESKKIERAAGKIAEKADGDWIAADSHAQEITAASHKLEVSDASLQTRIEDAESALVSAEKIVAGARGEQSDKTLRTTEAAARAAAKVAKEAAVEKQEQLRGIDAASIEARLSNAKAVLKRCSEDLQRSEERRRDLRLKVERDTERGPAKDADEAASHLAEVRQQHDRLESKAVATKLLHDVFKEHRKKARQRYNQPFRDRIERFGRVVYGSSFEVVLADDLSIERRTLDGTTLNFRQLSTGAQEQLGLLARLACATLVADEGGVPVIFDDALGWTDPGRLGRMGAAISTAAEDCQIIILTCVPDRYSAVGKASTVTLS